MSDPPKPVPKDSIEKLCQLRAGRDATFGTLKEQAPEDPLLQPPRDETPQAPAPTGEEPAQVDAPTPTREEPDTLDAPTREETAQASVPPVDTVTSDDPSRVSEL